MTRTPDDVYALVVDQNAQATTDINRLVVAVCVLAVVVAVKLVATVGLLVRVIHLLREARLYFQAAAIIGKQTDTAREVIKDEHTHVALVAAEAKEKLAVIGDDVKAVKEVIVEGKTPPPPSGEVVLHNRRADDPK